MLTISGAQGAERRGDYFVCVRVCLVCVSYGRVKDDLLHKFCVDVVWMCLGVCDYVPCPLCECTMQVCMHVLPVSSVCTLHVLPVSSVCTLHVLPVSCVLPVSSVCTLHVLPVSCVCTLHVLLQPLISLQGLTTTL